MRHVAAGLIVSGLIAIAVLLAIIVSRFFVSVVGEPWGYVVVGVLLALAAVIALIDWLSERRKKV